MKIVAVLASVALWSLAAAAAEGQLSVRIEERNPGGVAAVRSVDLYSRSHALVIGNDNYGATGWPRLSNAIKDARAVADALKAQGFDVSVRSNTTRAELVAALEDFVYGPGSDPLARIVIWYAGHGHTVAGEGYLVPADAPDPSMDALFRRNALSLRRFGEYMREIKSSHVLAVFDACFAGTVFDTARSPLSAVIGRATLMPVRQFISAGEADQQVSDDGSFRRLFIGALTGEEPLADANADGYVTGSEIGLFLEQRVTSITEGKQTPRSGKLRGLGFDRGDIVFDVRQPGPRREPRSSTDMAAAAPPPRPSTAPAPVESPAADEPAKRAPPAPSVTIAARAPEVGAATLCRKVDRTQKAIPVKAGDRLCSRSLGDSAIVKRITDKAVVYSVNGGFEQSCKTTDFCGFDWTEQLMFNVRIVRGQAGVAAAAELLPYRR